jgi:hypothetical protein
MTANTKVMTLSAEEFIFVPCSTWVSPVRRAMQPHRTLCVLTPACAVMTRGRTMRDVWQSEGAASQGSGITGKTYLERGEPVRVLVRWNGKGPRNVLIERADGSRVVRPFRGLRRLPETGDVRDSASAAV